MAEQISASDLARDLGVSTQAILDALADVVGDAPQALDEPLPSEAVELVRQQVTDAKEKADETIGELAPIGADLITRAFELAQAAGKPDWRRMSSAVLKNRILDLTERSFDERAWGVESFSAWLTLFSDLVRVDHRQHPPVVELLGGEETPVATLHANTHAAALPARPWKVRRDLWLAVVTPDTEGQWGWVDGAAVVIGDEPSPGARLPHISASEMQELRLEFVAHLPDQLRSETVEPLLDRWARELLPSATIPPRHRALWNGTLKRAVVDRLQAWFRDQQREPPTDLIEEIETFHARKHDATEELRSLITRCVGVMTQDELEEIALPAGVVLRAQRR